MEYSLNISLFELLKKQSLSIDTPLKGLIDYETKIIFDYPISLFTVLIVCTFGISNNVVNIIIFHRQGLDNTMNIGFFTLAISDLASLITLFFSFLCICPFLYTSHFPIDFPRVQYLISGWPHICFGNITCWITAYITAERCLCIALPLKVKILITPRITSTIIAVIYAVNILFMIPDFIYTYFDWGFVSERNRTLLTLAARENLKDLEGISFFALGMLGFISFPIVVVFTIVLVVKLKHQATWRQKTVRDGRPNENPITSRREIKTMNMVALIAAILIFCYIPGALVSIATFIVPEFKANARYANMWYVVWAIAFTTHGINSSVNIFLYYTMSTKFKKNFHEIFHCCLTGEVDECEN